MHLDTPVRVLTYRHDSGMWCGTTVVKGKELLQQESWLQVQVPIRALLLCLRVRCLTGIASIIFPAV